MFVALALTLIVIAILVFVLFLVPFAQEMGEKCAAHATATQQAAGDQQLQDAMLLFAALVVLSAEEAFTSLFAPFTQEVRAYDARAIHQWDRSRFGGRVPNGYTCNGCREAAWAVGKDRSYLVA
jgi:hypothetical protein